MKKTLKILISLSALLGVGLIIAVSQQAAPIYTIRTEIALPATRDQVWAILADFGSYPDWNPYLTQVEGTLAPGEALAITLVDANFDGPLDVVARVGEVNPPHRFFWTGRLGVPGLFDTRHVFALSQSGDKTTTLQHYEEFRGVLAAILPDRDGRSAKTRDAFSAMNRALELKVIQEQSTDRIH